MNGRSASQSHKLLHVELQCLPMLHNMSNAPMAHLELPDESRVFYYKLLHVAGDVEPAEGVTAFAWLTKAELATRLDPATAALATEMCGPFD